MMTSYTTFFYRMNKTFLISSRKGGEGGEGRGRGGLSSREMGGGSRLI